MLKNLTPRVYVCIVYTTGGLDQQILRYNVLIKLSLKKQVPDVKKNLPGVYYPGGLTHWVIVPRGD